MDNQILKNNKTVAAELTKAAITIIGKDIELGKTNFDDVKNRNEVHCAIDNVIQIYELVFRRVKQIQYIH